MKIIFEKIIPTKNQINDLFFLLKNKNFNISHVEIPSKKEHSLFVENNPYIMWYLLYQNNNLLGSVYLQDDNSVGINLLYCNTINVSEVINFIKKNHKPKPPIKSVRRENFFINISSKNTTMIKIMQKLNKIEIQHSFLI